jgi:hypothetical protein
MLNRLLYWSTYTVIRWQLILLALLVWIAWIFLKKNYEEEDHFQDSFFWEVMHNGYIPVVIGTLVILVSFSILTAVIAWAWFFFSTRRKGASYKVQFGENNNAEAGLVPVTVTLAGALRPLLGTIRARLVFSGMKLSRPILLDEGVYPKGSLMRTGISGKGQTELHDRGIYDVEEVQVFFCDMLRLVALPITIRSSQQLFTLPREQESSVTRAQPNTTEEQTHRIEIPKRVEGEFLNYKDFETGDDVRRIVWKIYARSGQLVVRIPETLDPYASHLYFYASFYNKLSDSAEGLFETELLNLYKDKLRNLFEALQKNGFDMRLPHDQETPKLQGMSEKRNELFHISAAHWQKDIAPREFVQVKKAAFVAVSSAAPAEEISRMLDGLPLNVPVVAIRLSDAIASPFRFGVRELFFKPKKDPAESLRKPWLLSPFRSKLLKNERDLRQLFERRGNAWIVSSVKPV